MKMSPVITAIGGLVFAIPVAYLGYHAHNLAEDIQAKGHFNTELATLKSEINALKKINAELNDLKQKIALLENQKDRDVLQSRSQDMQKSKTNQYDVNEEFAKDPEQLAKQQQEQSAQQLAQMNTTFLAESADQQWATQTTHLVTSFFDSEQGRKIDVADIQCRKTLCKIVLNNVDKGNASNTLALNFPMHVGAALSQARYFHDQNDDGTTNVTIFLARNGYELPAEL